ncbi:MAG: hypothetical protein ABEN55_02405 [Bradymonadaceae bacterium]
MNWWKQTATTLAAAAIGLVVAVDAHAADPVQNPAQDAAEKGSEKDKKKKKKKGKEGKKGDEAVDVPAVQVKGQKEQPKANDPVGTYKQPRWTVRRPFSASRVYVNPAGYAEANIFYSPSFSLSEPSETTVETEYEFEIGLGHRLQFDAYLVGLQEGGWNAPFRIAEKKFEVRWAFADWGKIWGNPTLYFEWAHANKGHPAIEPKLLLGGNLSDKAFAALNLDVEGEYETIPGKKNEYSVLAGPSLQWYPLEPVHIGLTTFVGPKFEIEAEEGEIERSNETMFRGMMIAGYEF